MMTFDTSLQIFNTHQTTGECRTRFWHSSHQTLSAWAFILKVIRPCAERVWLHQTNFFQHQNHFIITHCIPVQMIFLLQSSFYAIKILILVMLILLVSGHSSALSSVGWWSLGCCCIASSVDPWPLSCSTVLTINSHKNIVTLCKLFQIFNPPYKSIITHHKLFHIFYPLYD